MLDLAKQTAEQGIGDNDLKRLKRQFDSNKATYVNIEQKERFMKGEQATAKATLQGQQPQANRQPANMLSLLLPPLLLCCVNSGAKPKHNLAAP